MGGVSDVAEEQVGEGGGALAAAQRETTVPVWEGAMDPGVAELSGSVAVDGR